MIQLQTLDDAVITIGDREVRPTSPTLFAALLYLGVERGQRVSRAALQELLFPETDERSGAHSMRQLLYKLRQLGASVHAEGDVVWLAPEDVVDDYSAPAHTNGNGNGNGKGHGHGAGGFLAGYAPRVSKAFDEWLESRRSAVEAARRRALIKYMLARRDVADWITVERIAQEVLATDPFNEEATFALAESTALGGSKSEAIRMLERYEGETGRADLKLPAAILRRRISERLPDRRRRALDTPFVGRDAEAEVMRQAVVNLRAGDGGSVVISGEPGIGKTRLIEETSAIALLEGVNVHVVRCQPHYVSRPMSVFIEWVPMLMQSRGALGVDPQTLEHLTLLTSHRDDRANRPTDARDDATRSGTLMAAVRDLVDAVASETPILLVVEDAHWADSTSLVELSTLLEKRRNSRLLVIHSARSIETLKTVGTVADSTMLLRLKPIDTTVMLNLSKHLLSSTPSPQPTGFDEWCAATASGNPLYLQMLCAHYDDTREAFAVPPGMRRATIRRLEQLPAESRRLLEYCALGSRHTSLQSLSELTHLGPEQFLGAVQGLEEAGLIGTRAGVVYLSHDLLTECVLELVPPLTRQLLHSRVAALLEARYERTRDTTVLWDCAEHWVASSDSSKALRFVLECAGHAATIGHAAQAFALIQRARPLALSVTDKLLLYQSLTESARALGKWSDIVVAVAEARELFNAEFRTEVPWEWRFRELEAQWALSGGTSVSVTPLTDCLNSSGAEDLHRIQAAQMLVRMAHEMMDAELAHEAFRAVGALLNDQSTDYATRMLPLMYHTTFGDHAEARRVARKIVEDLGISGIFGINALRVARNTAAAYTTLGEPQESLRLSQRYYEQSVRIGSTQWQYDFACNCCSVHVSMIERVAAEHWFVIAEGLRQKAMPLMLDFIHLATGIDLAIWRGDRIAAETRLSELEKLPASTSARLRVVLTASRVRVAQMDRHYNSAVREIEDLSQLVGPATVFGVGDTVAMALSEALRRRGDGGEARRTVRAFLDARRDNGLAPPELTRLID